MISITGTQSVNSFYNAIALDYDSHMTESDNRVRETVSHLFKQWVRSGNVLDFGGGTGLDLPWLLDQGYQVFFLEPSFNMREIAKKASMSSLSLKSPVFIEENTDISEWSAKHIPFREKMLGVLANFAVLNCIKNIDTFFEKMALACHAHGYIIATVLDPRPRVIFNRYSIFSVLRILLTGKLRILIKHREAYHETYIHSIKSIKKASNPYFKIKSYQYLQPSAFAVFIFSKI